jgi:hypothetical protein
MIGQTPAPSNSTSGSPISNPRVIYVRTDGNDGTGEVGNPALPFATATAAHSAGVTAGVTFVLDLGVGTFSIDSASGVSAFCQHIRGRGGFDGANFATHLTINASAGPATVNANGAHAANWTVYTSFLTLFIYANGQNVEVTDESSYTAGDGGTIVVFGHGSTSLDLSVYGGGDDSSLNGSVTGGTAGGGGLGGPCKISGCRLLGFNYSGGAGFGVGLSGNEGSVEFYNCDLTALGSFPASTSVGQSKVTSSVPGTDKGGNSTW